MEAITISTALSLASFYILIDNAKQRGCSALPGLHHAFSGSALQVTLCFILNKLYVSLNATCEGETYSFFLPAIGVSFFSVLLFATL